MAGIITAEGIAELLRRSPDWALAGLTSPQELMSADAPREVARHVYEALYLRSS